MSEMKPHSIPDLIDAIDDHPLRWEAITIESVLSLPTLATQNDRTHVEFFFYPVGGPIDNRQVWAPYYRVTSSANAPYDIQYQPIQPNELDNIPTESPLGSGNLNISSRTEYDAQLKILYTLAAQLIDLYPKPIDTLTESEQQAIADYRHHFNQLVHQPVLPAYIALNPTFFQWLDVSTHNTKRLRTY
jgi:hypothetical protein